jgi:electron transfer flavoprotein alpha subunit
MNNVLVIAELAGDRPSGATLENVALARSLALDARVIVLLLASDEAAAKTLIARGAECVVLGNRSLFDDYDSDAWVTCATNAAKQYQVSLVLMPHTPQGGDLAPRLAFRLQAGCATGCVRVERQNNAMHFTRAAHGGNVRETLRFTTNGAVATVRAGICDALPADDKRTGEIIALDNAPASRIRIIGRRKDASSTQRLEDAKVIVSGGRGLNGPEGFEVLAPLARVLGGAVGASRVPCDLGWCSHAMQIGLTGKTVTPELYIAVGISGASHHLAGCGNAKTIVAINTDADAAIFREAKFGVVGDYSKIVPALTAALLAASKTS